jgi:hypothetical protein
MKRRRILGLWYSHFNQHRESDEHLLGLSLDSVKRAVASSECDVEIRTCVWSTLGALNPFPENVTGIHHSSHVGITLQILRLLYEQRDAGKEFDLVTFHEHDVLYPEGYFDRFAAAIRDDDENETIAAISRATYGDSDVTEAVRSHIVDGAIDLLVTNDALGGDPMPGKIKALRIEYINSDDERQVAEFGEWSRCQIPLARTIGISNLDYIGLRRTGWCDVNQRDEPLHELACRWPDVIDHFEWVLRQCISNNSELLEFNNLLNVQLPFVGERPSVHICHGRCLTSHSNIYRDEGDAVHPYWGTASDIWHEDWPQ